MADFRIILSSVRDIDPELLAVNIRAAHGDNFDAALGDFVVTRSGDTITIDVKEVGGGDIDMLADDIENGEGGTFSIRVVQKVGDNLYGRDPGDDVIE